MSMVHKLLVPALIAGSGVLGLTGCAGTSSNGAGTTAPAAPASATGSAAPSTAPSGRAAPVSAPSASAAAPQQALVSAVIDDCAGKAVPRPSYAVLTCADAGWVLENLKWTNWGSPTASATGEWSEKNCKPNCATGGITRYPVTVTVSDLRGTAYTHMSLSAPTSPTPKASFELRSTGPVLMPAK